MTEEGSPAVCDNVDETGENCAKWVTLSETRRAEKGHRVTPPSRGEAATAKLSG